MYPELHSELKLIAFSRLFILCFEIKTIKLPPTQTLIFVSLYQ